MNEFGDKLQVSFFCGNTKLIPRENYPYTKLSNDGNLFLDLANDKDKSIIKLLLEINTLHIDGIVYKVVDREFMLDGTTLYIVIEKIK